VVLASQRVPCVLVQYTGNPGRQSQPTGAVRRVEWRSSRNRILELHNCERTRSYAALLVHRSGEQNLQFYWSGLATNYVYTLEGNEALASTNWLSLPGVSWPLKTNHWTLALTNTPVPFYRVRAK